MSDELPVPAVVPSITDVVDQYVLTGDLAACTKAQRLSFYNRMCVSLGLNPWTRPFQFIKLNGLLTLYACKDCTDQLRRVSNISQRVVSRTYYADQGVFEVVVQMKDTNGRVYEGCGDAAMTMLQEEEETLPHPDPEKAAAGRTVVRKRKVVTPLTGEAAAKARMVAQTRADRRSTLAFLGLGIVDESEIDSIQGAHKVSWDEAMGDGPKLKDVV
jgi:hypothetical protein